MCLWSLVGLSLVSGPFVSRKFLPRVSPVRDPPSRVSASASVPRRLLYPQTIRLHHPHPLPPFSRGGQAPASLSLSLSLSLPLRLSRTLSANSHQPPPPPCNFSLTEPRLYPKGTAGPLSGKLKNEESPSLPLVDHCNVIPVPPRLTKRKWKKCFFLSSSPSFPPSSFLHVGRGIIFIHPPTHPKGSSRALGPCPSPRARGTRHSG